MVQEFCLEKYCQTVRICFIPCSQSHFTFSLTLKKEKRGLHLMAAGMGSSNPAPLPGEMNECELIFIQCNCINLVSSGLKDDSLHHVTAVRSGSGSGMSRTGIGPSPSCVVASTSTAEATTTLSPRSLSGFPGPSVLNDSPLPTL